MSLHEEKAAALAEVLAATGEEIIWKGQTLHALVSDNPLSQDLGLGGFDAKGDCTMKVLRSELGADRPKLGEKIEFQETRLSHHARHGPPAVPDDRAGGRTGGLTPCSITSSTNVLLAHLKAVPALAALQWLHGPGQCGAQAAGADGQHHVGTARRVGHGISRRGRHLDRERSARHDACHSRRAGGSGARRPVDRARSSQHSMRPGGLHIYGYAPLGSEPTAGDARFTTNLRYRFGFGPA